MSTTAFPPLSEDGARAIDQLRQRLNQLSTSIGSLKTDLERQEPLPTWPSLQSSAQILSHNITQLLTTFETHREFLNAAHAYPLPSFPGHTQENLLNQLLRKRLEPTAEEWIKHNVEENVERIGRKADEKTTFTKDELQSLWAQAGPTSTSIVRGMIEEEDFMDDFTLAEREAGVENVRTGLKRRLWEEDEDEEEDAGDDKDADAMQITKEQPNGDAHHNETAALIPPMSTEAVLRVITSGRMPAAQAVT